MLLILQLIPRSILDSLEALEVGRPALLDTKETHAQRHTDPLPDEILDLCPVPIESGAEYDGFFALRELGTLVARRRGLDPNTFIGNLMMLFSDAEEAKSHHESVRSQEPPHETADSKKARDEETTPMRTLRRFQSQPQLSSDTKRRRHFSFEPGEDQLQALKEEATPTTSAVSYAESSPSSSSGSVIFLHTGLTSSSDDLASSEQVPSPDSQGRSKIPTPVLLFGSPRRQTSISSLQSSRTRSNDGRHNSQSSILTAYRDNHNAALRPEASSRSSSYHNSCGTDSSPASTGRHSSAHIRNSVAYPAASQAIDNSTRTSSTKDENSARSSSRVSTVGRASRAPRQTVPPEFENNNPGKASAADEAT